MGGTPATSGMDYGGPDADPELTDEETAAASGSSEPEVPWSSLLGQPRNILVLAGAVAAAAVVWLLSGDAGYAFWSGLVTAFIVASQVVDWVPFSFGAGFVGYRPDTALAAGGPGRRRRALELAARRGETGRRIETLMKAAAPRV